MLNTTFHDLEVQIKFDEDTQVFLHEIMLACDELPFELLNQEKV